MKRSKVNAWLLPLIIGGLVGCQFAAPTTPSSPPQLGLLQPQGGAGLEVSAPAVNPVMPPLTYYPFPIMPSFGGGSLSSDSRKGRRRNWKPEPTPCAEGLDAAWIDYFGTPGQDWGSDVVATPQGVIAVGLADADLETLVPGVSAYVRMYSHQGSLQWTRQFSGTDAAGAYGVAADQTGFYVAGMVRGTLPDTSTSYGELDVFVRKYDFQGNHLWSQQFGSSENDLVYQIVVDNGVVYVAGTTYGTLPTQTALGGQTDAFLLAYDTAGTFLWVRQVGSDQADFAFSVDARNGVAYVAGQTDGSLPGETHQNPGVPELFVQAYAANGTLNWTEQFGWSADHVALSNPRLAVTGDAIYLGAQISGAIPGQAFLGGLADVLLQQISLTGTLGWSRLHGSSDWDVTSAIRADASGIYLTGYTFAFVPEQNSYVSQDAYLMSFTLQGDLLQRMQYGGSEGVIPGGLSPYQGKIYLTGTTAGEFAGRPPWDPWMPS